MFRHSSRRLPLNDSINGLSVGFPEREKSIVTPCSLWPDTDDTPFSDETVIKELIDAGIILADAVNFLVDKYELVRIDRRGFSWQEQSSYLQVVDILRARQAIGSSSN